MQGAADTLTHPVFGSLRWISDDPHWYTEYRLPSGLLVDVMVEPGDVERSEALEPAAKLFTWAIDNASHVLADALEGELLDLDNQTWRRGDDPELGAADLAARLEWHLLALSPDGPVPVEFTYGAGDLFGGHGVVVEVDERLQFRDIDLR